MTMAGPVHKLLAVLMLQIAGVAGEKPVLKIGGLIQNTGIGLRGKKAFDLVKNAINNANLSYTMETLWSDYDHGQSDEDIAGVVKMLWAETHVLVCPYSTGASKRVIAAVPEGDTIPILVWGGATDSIFTETCIGRKCYGGFTVASQYMAPSLKRVTEIATTRPLKVSAITNNNGFSKAVDAGGKAFIAADGMMTLAGEYTLSVAKTSLEAEDVDEVKSMMTREQPDVVMISGHPGDVEQVIDTVRSVHVPKAIIATNAFSNVDGNVVDYMHGVIMPEQWAEDPSMKDSIVHMTSADFTKAMESAGETASYHAASAGGLALVLAYAMESRQEGSSQAEPGQISQIMEIVKAAKLSFKTFYGEIAFNEDGSIDASSKPMYGKQAQGNPNGYQIVAPTGPIMYPIPEAMPQSGPELTCGDIKEAYRMNKCCGMPSKVFSMSNRRLNALNQPESKDSLLSTIAKQLAHAKAQSPSEGKRLASKIKALVSRWE
mmetsp:Transcript_50811/g.88604  ORF Transcript_50811/g.88604 Transcript_50811/m.88604 type:complete len:489 (+) Transcript_50811:82-1548(+)